MPDYRIEKMPLAEVETTIDWAAREGWNPGLGDAPCFYAIDPSGFLMGVLDGRPIARCRSMTIISPFAGCISSTLLIAGGATVSH